MPFGFLKIVIIDSPYENSNDPQALDLFGKTLQLKLNGYRAEYAHGALPVDTFDFIATHILICDETAQMRPLMAYKSTTLTRAKSYSMQFPLIAALQSSSTLEHARAVQKIVDKCEKMKTELVYGAGMTIHPEVRKNSELSSRVQEMMIAASLAHDIESKNAEALTAGVNRFKLHRLFHFMGYKNLENTEGQELPPFASPFLLGEKATIYYRTEISNESLTLIAKYKKHWDSRLDLSFTEAKREIA